MCVMCLVEVGRGQAYENVERCSLSIARTTMILTDWPLHSIRCPEAASSEKHVC